MCWIDTDSELQTCQKGWEENKRNVRLERIWKDKEILKGLEFLVKMNRLFNTCTIGVYLQRWQSWPLGSVLESSYFSLLQQDTDCPPCLPKLLVKETALFSHVLQQVRNVAQWIEHKAAAVRPVRITSIFHWMRTHNRAMMSLCPMKEIFLMKDFLILSIMSHDITEEHI